MTIIPLRVARQTYDFDCGASALQVVMEYYGVEIRNDRIRKELKTDENGTSYIDMIALAEKRGFQVFAVDNVTLEQLKGFIDAGYPVIVLVQAWAERYMTLAEWRKNYEDGHYVVVIGYQDNIIVFEDPSSIRRTWLTEKEFLARWHDIDDKIGNKLEHFAMVLMGKEPVIRASEHMD
jgi:predicted double-glycine peptidase